MQTKEEFTATKVGYYVSQVRHVKCVPLTVTMTCLWAQNCSQSIW